LLDSTSFTEHIPTEELKELLQSQIADFCPENALEQHNVAHHPPQIIFES